MMLGLKTWRALLAVSYRSIEERASQENILSTFLDSEYNYLHILEYKMTPVLSKGRFDEILKSDSRFTVYSSGISPSRRCCVDASLCRHVHRPFSRTAMLSKLSGGE